MWCRTRRHFPKPPLFLIKLLQAPYNGAACIVEKTLFPDSQQLFHLINPGSLTGELAVAALHQAVGRNSYVFHWLIMWGKARSLPKDTTHPRRAIPATLQGHSYLRWLLQHRRRPPADKVQAPSIRIWRLGIRKGSSLHQLLGRSGVWPRLYCLSLPAARQCSQDQSQPVTASQLF
jgi:hypothetical protein